MLAGMPTRVGSVVSWTVTWNEASVVRPPPSVTEQATVVVPNANVEPEAGLHVGVGGTASSASDAVTEYAATAPAGLVASRVMSAGRESVGGVFGTTSIWN